jgi:hypothetical protein
VIHQSRDQPVLIFDNRVFIIRASLLTNGPLHAAPAPDPINPTAAPMFQALILNASAAGRMPRSVGLSGSAGHDVVAACTGAPPGS